MNHDPEFQAENQLHGGSAARGQTPHNLQSSNIILCPQAAPRQATRRGRNFPETGRNRRTDACSGDLKPKIE